MRLRAERLGDGGARGAGARRDLARGGDRDARGRAARRLRDRLDPDAARRGDDRRARARSGQVREAAGAIMEVAKRHRLRRRPGRPRDQGGRGRRARGCSSTWSTACSSSRASASAASGPCARSRTASARPARSASSRCAPAGWSRSSIPSARFVAEASAAPGLGRPLLDGGHAAAAGRGPGAGRPDRDRAAAPGRQRDRPQPPGDGARGARPPRRARRSPAPTCSSTSPAASASTSRAPTSRSPWRWSRRSAASRSPTPSGRPLACFGEVGLTGELRPVGHADRRVAEAVKFGLCAGARPGGPGGAGRRSSRRPSLRGAIRAALGRRRARSSRPLDKRHSYLSTRNCPGCSASRAFAIMDRCSTPETS